MERAEEALSFCIKYLVGNSIKEALSFLHHEYYTILMFGFLEVLKNEILSYFVPEKMEYKITGHCLKCGKCCRYMYSFDTYTTTDFKILQFLFAS